VPAGKTPAVPDPHDAFMSIDRKNITASPTDITTSTTMRAAARAGIAGQIALTVGSVVATVWQDDKYDAARHDMSDMAAIGVPHAWFVQLYQGVAGITMIAFVWLALRPALAGVRGRTLTAILLTLTWGLGMLSDVFFRIDCRAADGCTPEQQIRSWHATVHASTTLLLLVLAVTPYVVARCLRRSPGWARLARPSVWFGIAIDLVMVVTIAIGTQWGAGYAQRLLLLLGATWTSLLAAWVLHLGERRDA
jgi:hypothetical protein